MAYLAPMERRNEIDEIKAMMGQQLQIDELKASSKRQKIAIIAWATFAVFFAVKPYGTITCDGWRVVDDDGKVRIDARTLSNGDAGVRLLDRDGEQRMYAVTTDQNASVMWLDKDGKIRIAAGTNADGNASVMWRDKDGKARIAAATDAKGTVLLPTEDVKKWDRD
jgi:hypothetical protein